MFVVVHEFSDLQDKNHVYRVGDVYPRDGYKPSIERQNELSSIANKIGKQLIKEVADNAISDTSKKTVDNTTTKEVTQGEHEELEPVVVKKNKKQNKVK